MHLSGFFGIDKVAELKQIASVAEDLNGCGVSDNEVEVVLTYPQNIVVGAGKSAFEFKITFCTYGACIIIFEGATKLLW